MKLSLLLLSLFILYQVFGSQSDLSLDLSVIKFAENLKKVINSNEKNRVSFASIFVVDFTKSVDVDGILKLVSQDNDVVIEGITRKPEFNKEQHYVTVDYLLILRDQHTEVI
jgi:hypothetical protein